MSKYNFIYAKEDQTLEPHENHIPFIAKWKIATKHRKLHYYIVSVGIG